MTVTLDYADKIAIVRLGEDESFFSPGFWMTSTMCSAKPSQMAPKG